MDRGNEQRPPRPDDRHPVAGRRGEPGGNDWTAHAYGADCMKRRLATAVLALLVAAACVVVMLPDTSYFAQDREAIMSGATPHHRGGTDELGRDRGVRVAAAVLLGLGGAAAAAAITTAIAAGIGAV